eukprot:CAMPEP_0177597386 /NCGR_PEP_ID=MMETSP0419_2-20121207/11679_1 /TAXON_ID=582737 /ORGANISM="Tetraselmis sp., Strain GSL018" /LENGTH=422 /DNA_ID=CAMNT_0019089543 /DNA_START=580 /DNA_END=1848 /DNA_ORIENTATION=-
MNTAPRSGHSSIKRLSSRRFSEVDLGALHDTLPEHCQVWCSPKDFNGHLLSRSVKRPLATLATAALRKVIAELGLSSTKFQNFAQSVENAMPDNNYHNSVHVLDVLQLMFWQTCDEGPLERICRDPVVKLSALLAALVHDLEHPGVNNTFLRSSDHPIVSKFGMESPSEHMHVSAFKNMLADPDINFLEGFQSSDHARVMDLVERTVLATDMSKHLTLVNAIMPIDDEHALRLRLALGMKIADLSHCVRNFRAHYVFVDMLKEEFYAQGDKERALNLSVSDGMDRMESYATVAGAQVNFLSLFIAPLFERWVEHNPTCFAAKELLILLQWNIQTWGLLAVKPAGPDYDDEPTRRPRRSTVHCLTPEARRQVLGMKSFSMVARSYGIEYEIQDIDSVLKELDAARTLSRKPLNGEPRRNSNAV